jgi:hypothetical protein
MACVETREPDVIQPPVPAGPDAGAEDEGLRFDDPYWDDAFCAWWDPTLRTCCG